MSSTGKRGHYPRVIKRCVYTIGWLSNSQARGVRFSGNNKRVIIYTGTGNFVRNSEFSNSGFQSIFYYTNKKEKFGTKGCVRWRQKFRFCQIPVFSNYTVWECASKCEHIILPILSTTIFSVLIKRIWYIPDATIAWLCSDATYNIEAIYNTVQ